MSVQSASRSLFIFLILAVVAFATPVLTHATQDDADKMCDPYVKNECGCMMEMKGNPPTCQPGPNKLLCPCSDVTNGGKTTGQCVATHKCLGQSTSGSAGQKGGALGMDQLMGALKGIMDALKGSGGSGSTPPPPPPSGTGTTGGCTSFTPTSIQGNPDPCTYYVPSAGNTNDSSGLNLGGTNSGCTTYTQTSIQNDPNPCSYYVPAGLTGGTINTTTATNSATVNTGCTSYTQTSVPNSSDPCTFYVPASTSGDDTTGNNTKTGTGVTTNVVGTGSTDIGEPTEDGSDNSDATSSVTDSGNSHNVNNINVVVNLDPPKTFFSTFLNSIMGLSGAGGNIDVTDKGATIYAGNADTKSNTSVVGFYGSNTTNGAQPTGIVSRLCVSRPWAGSFFSFLIPASFFDNLCKLRGYQVGTPPPVTAAPAVIKRPPPPPPPPPPPVATTTIPVVYIPPQADIWAVPLIVPIGARTSLFWSSKGVKSCIVTSPDGNFSETALSGGASTVPIVTDTVFTISCIAMDDSHVTNTVTVHLKI